MLLNRSLPGGAAATRTEVRGVVGGCHTFLEKANHIDMGGGVFVLVGALFVLAVFGAHWFGTRVGRTYQAGRPQPVPGDQALTCPDAQADLAQIQASIDATNQQIARRTDDLKPWTIAAAFLVAFTALGGLAALGTFAGSLIPAAVVLLVIAGLLIIAIAFVIGVISGIQEEIDTLKARLRDLQAQLIEAQAAADMLCGPVSAVPPVGNIVAPA